jgi:CRP-like cAMP-binding protein
VDSILKIIDGFASFRSYPKQNLFALQGEIPRSAFVLKEGIVKAYSINAAGNEQIASFHTAGDIFPVTWVFNKSSNSIYNYEAVTDCKVYAVDKEILLNKIFSSPALLRSAFDYAMGNYTSTLLRITALEQSKASEKVMFTLYYLAHRYGKAGSAGTFSIKLSLTHSVIADMVGITRETVTHELNVLKKAGAIRYTTKEYTVNQAVLEKMMGEDSFSSLKT